MSNTGAMAAPSEAERAKAMMAIQSIFDKYANNFSLLSVFTSWNYNYLMVLIRYYFPRIGGLSARHFIFKWLL
jgi:hypothetical protein